MRRKGVLIGTLVVALFLFAAVQPASAQLDVTPTELILEGDPPSPPWSIDGGVGQTTEAFVYVTFCWSDIGLNPLEGKVIVSLGDLPPNTDEIEVRPRGSLDDMEFIPPLYEPSPDGDCHDRLDWNFDFVITQEFKGKITRTFEFQIEVEGEDTGTYVIPSGGTVTMQVEAEWEEDIFAQPTDNDNDENGNDDGPPEAEESPAPAVVFMLVLGGVAATLLRRRS